MTGELDAVLGYVDELRQLDTEGVEPMTHAVPFDCPLRDGRGRRRRCRSTRRSRNAPRARGQLLPGAAHHPRPGSGDGERMSLPDLRGAHAIADRRRRARAASGAPATSSRATSTASRASTARSAAYLLVDAEGARRTRRRGRRARWPRAAIPGRSPACRSGSRTSSCTRGRRDHLRARRSSRASCRPTTRTVVGAAGGRRRGHARQAQHGRVRDGLVERELRVQAGAQPLGPHARAGRLVGRLGRGGGGGAVRGRARHRHGRLDPAAGGAVRRRRASSRPTGACRATA